MSEHALTDRVIPAHSEGPFEKTIRYFAIVQYDSGHWYTYPAGPWTDQAAAHDLMAGGLIRQDYVDYRLLQVLLPNFLPVKP